MGIVVNEGAIIYKQPNFDSEVLAYAQAGKKLEMSSKLFEGAFYKVRLKPGVMGYIADSDIRPPKAGKHRAEDDEKKEKAFDKRRKENVRKKPFSVTQYVGLAALQANFKERTMDRQPTDRLTLMGMKLFGPNLIFEGLTVSEINFLVSTSAPKYYEQATGRPASGFILIGDFLFQTTFLLSPSSMASIGFGPMIRYNKFDVQLTNQSTGSVSQFSLEDIAFGVALSAGLGLRLGPTALRLEAKYHYEYASYFGYGAALQYGF